MLFSSIPFLYYFLPVVLLVYLAAPKRLKNGVLLLSSLLFYAWGEKLLVFLFAFSIVFGWIMGLLIEKMTNPKAKKGLMILTVIFDLGLLGYFKYADFFIANINSLTGLGLPLLKVALPIGISFYTFQLLSYIIDVYRGSPAQKNLVDFGAYVSMFPQLIAGPIVRYTDIKDQLRGRKHSLEMVSQGIGRFTVGLCKKIFIANLLGEVCAHFRGTTELTVLYYWMYALAFVLQIYFDFSGYSDMAIGLGKIFGFHFMENFDYPYISKSITEFWRRWHISLGSWFRDYVYIPLGGNRKGMSRQLLNILIVWALTGLWHGAAWNFVLWGLFYAFFLTIEKMGFKKVLDRLPVLGHIYTLICVLIGFVLFNADSLSQAAGDLAGLIAFGRLPLSGPESLYYLRSYGLIFMVGILCATPLPKRIYEKLRTQKVAGEIMDIVMPFVIALALLLVTGYLVDGSFNPFLYFRF